MTNSDQKNDSGSESESDEAPILEPIGSGGHEALRKNNLLECHRQAGGLPAHDFDYIFGQIYPQFGGQTAHVLELPTVTANQNDYVTGFTKGSPVKKWCLDELTKTSVLPVGATPNQHNRIKYVHDLLKNLEDEIKKYGDLEENSGGPLEQINYFLSEVNKQNFTQDQWHQIDQQLQNLIQEDMIWLNRSAERRRTHHTTQLAYDAKMGIQLIKAHNAGSQLPSVLAAKMAAREARETISHSERLLLLHNILGKTGKIPQQKPKSEKKPSPYTRRQGARQR